MDKYISNSGIDLSFLENVDLKKLVEKFERLCANGYKNFIENELVDNPLWIRNVKYYPNISEKDRWIIWQYSNRGRVYGIDGFTDKNVLRYDKMINEL